MEFSLLAHLAHNAQTTKLNTQKTHLLKPFMWIVECGWKVMHTKCYFAAISRIRSPDHICIRVLHTIRVVPDLWFCSGQMCLMLWMASVIRHVYLTLFSLKKVIWIWNSHEKEAKISFNCRIRDGNMSRAYFWSTLMAHTHHLNYYEFQHWPFSISLSMRGCVFFCTCVRHDPWQQFKHFWIA